MGTALLLRATWRSRVVIASDITQAEKPSRMDEMLSSMYERISVSEIFSAAECCGSATTRLIVLCARVCFRSARHKTCECAYSDKNQDRTVNTLAHQEHVRGSGDAILWQHHPLSPRMEHLCAPNNAVNVNSTRHQLCHPEPDGQKERWSFGVRERTSCPRQSVTKSSQEFQAGTSAHDFSEVQFHGTLQ